MAIMVNKMMGNYQLDMALAAACDSDVVDHCSIEKNTRVEGKKIVSGPTKVNHVST